MIFCILGLLYAYARLKSIQKKFWCLFGLLVCLQQFWNFVSVNPWIHAGMIGVGAIWYFLMVRVAPRTCEDWYALQAKEFKIMKG